MNAAAKFCGSVERENDVLRGKSPNRAGEGFRQAAKRRQEELLRGRLCSALVLDTIGCYPYSSDLFLSEYDTLATLLVAYVD